MSDEVFTAQLDNPEHVARAMEILQNRIAKLESQNQALNMLLIAVCMSLGLNRHSPFVTHSEIEAALLSMQDLTVNGAYGDDPKSTAMVACLLSRQ